MGAAGLFICFLVYAGYYLGVHHAICRYGKLGSSKLQPVDYDNVEAGLSKVYELPKSEVEVAEQQHDNPLLGKVAGRKPNLGIGNKIGIQIEEKAEEKRADIYRTSSTSVVEDKKYKKKPATPLMGPRIALVQRFVDHENEEDVFDTFDAATTSTAVREGQESRFKSLKYGRLYRTRMKRMVIYSEDTTMGKRSLLAPSSVRRKASIASAKIGVAPPSLLPDNTSTTPPGDKVVAAAAAADDDDDAIIDGNDIYLADETGGENYNSCY